jgi:hypothetical protein
MRAIRWGIGVIGAACGGVADIEPTPDPESPPAETDAPPAPARTARPIPDFPPPPVPPVDPTTVAPNLTATPPPGIYDADVDVALACSDPTATIWYTTDGAPPVPGASDAWSGPIRVPRGLTLRAVCENAHGDDELSGAWLRMEAGLVGYDINLPSVVLWTLGEAPEFKTEDYTRFHLSVFEPGAGGRTTFPAEATVSVPAGLKIRGSSSAGYAKHPYRLETWDALADEDDDVALLGMPEDADWVLLAPADFDRALLRDPLMYRLSNLIGRYAPRTRYAEVFLADRGEAIGRDDFIGLYVIAERIERGPDRVDVTKLLPTDVTAPDVTGGYLFKEDRTGPGEFGFYAGQAGGLLQFQQPFVWVDPAEDEVVPEQAAYLQALLDELGVALTSPGFTHPVTGRHYRDLIDVDAWIDHHILNVLAKNPDAFRLSGYFHKDRDDLIAAGPIWDFDRTMGCASDYRADNPTWWDAQNVTPDCTPVFTHGFWEGLFSDPTFRTAYFDRWRALLTTTLTVALIHAEIDALAQELTEAAPRNFAVWPEYAPRGGSHAAEVQTLKDWIAARHGWISGCLNRADPRLCSGR